MLRRAGLVFGISAPDQYPIVVTRIKCARHPWSRRERQALTVLVSPHRTQDDRAATPADIGAWTLAGCSSAMPESFDSSLPTLSVFDADPQYGDLPLKHPFVVEAGMQRSVALHSDDPHGIIIRREGRLSVGALDGSSSACPSQQSPGLVTRVGMALEASLKAKPRSPGQPSPPVARTSKPVSFVGHIVYRRVPRL